MKAVFLLIAISLFAVKACPCPSSVRLNEFSSGGQHCDCNYLPDADSSFVTADQDALDHYYMQMAIDIGKNNPSNPYGSVIVDHNTNEVLCVGYNNKTVRYDNHGERAAIDNCTATVLPNGPNGAKHPRWANTTLYTNVESCMMCAASIMNRGITRTVYGAGLEGYAPLCYTIAQITEKEYYDHANAASSYPQPGTPMQVRGPLADMIDQIWAQFPNKCT